MSFRVYYLAPTVELACGRRKVEVVWFTCLSAVCWVVFLSVFHSVCLFVRLLVSFCCCFPNDCNSGSCFSPSSLSALYGWEKKKISFQCNLCFFFFFFENLLCDSCCCLPKWSPIDCLSGSQNFAVHRWSIFAFFWNSSHRLIVHRSLWTVDKLKFRSVQFGGRHRRCHHHHRRLLRTISAEHCLTRVPPPLPDD